jgi:hypothetical protein
MSRAAPAAHHPPAFSRVMKRKQTPEICPVCGERVPPNAAACPACGACHNSGWKEDAGIHDGLDLPDDDFDYDEFVRREFGGGVNPATGNAIWWVTGLVLLLIILAGAIRLSN